MREMLGAVKVLQGRHRIRESFMGSPRVGAGSSEVEAAEGTTRERSKICHLPVSVVLSIVTYSQVVAGALSLCSSTRPWDRRLEQKKARAGWEPPVTLSCSQGIFREWWP